jgi:DNA-binding protein H-NS
MHVAAWRDATGKSEPKVKHSELELMTLEGLWSLRESVAAVLAGKLRAEKARLEQRLRKLARSAGVSATNRTHARRPYPKVVPKYRNPARPSETWAGRGKTPRWLAAQLTSGKRLDDFRIVRPNNRAR